MTREGGQGFTDCRDETIAGTDSSGGRGDGEGRSGGVDIVVMSEQGKS